MAFSRDELRLDDRCGLTWNQLSGAEGIRYCEHCERNVHDIEGMTVMQVGALIRSGGGRLCASFQRPPMELVQHPASPTERGRRWRNGLRAIGFTLMTGLVCGSAAPMPDLAWAEDNGVQPAIIGQVICHQPLLNSDLGRIHILYSDGSARDVALGPDGRFRVDHAPLGKVRFTMFRGRTNSQHKEAYLGEDGLRVSLYLESEPRMGTVTIPSPRSVYYRELDRIMNGVECEDVFGERLCEADPQGFPVIDYLAAGGDPNRRFGSAVALSHLAVIAGEGSVLASLIEAGADLELRDFRGLTPLMLSALMGRTELMTQLIEAGSRTDKIDAHGQSALHHACMSYGSDALEALLSCEPMLDLVDEWGESAMMKAAIRGDENAILMLLDRGARLDHRNSWGQTALILAVFSGREEAVRLLLTFGSDLSTRDNEGLTASDHATRLGRKDVMKHLESWSE